MNTSGGFLGTQKYKAKSFSVLAPFSSSAVPFPPMWGFGVSVLGGAALQTSRKAALPLGNTGLEKAGVELLLHPEVIFTNKFL